MKFNTFSAVAVMLPLTLATASAATIPADLPAAASISAHDAYARFDKNGYMPIRRASDDGVAQGNGGVPHDEAPPSPLSHQAEPPSFVPQVGDDPSPNQVRRIQENGAPKVSSDGGIDLFDGPGDGTSPTKVGTVPLPAGLPLFGAALLVLSALGYGARRHARAQRLIADRGKHGIERFPPKDGEPRGG